MTCGGPGLCAGGHVPLLPSREQSVALLPQQTAFDRPRYGLDGDFAGQQRVLKLDERTTNTELTLAEQNTHAFVQIWRTNSQTIITAAVSRTIAWLNSPTHRHQSIGPCLDIIILSS